jgi:glycosyltransferase involved in cell wall biosynthesis
MKVEFLISTMNRRDLSFLEPMFSNVDKENFSVSIVNQCTSIEPPQINTPSNIKILSIKARGLSQSRNLLLQTTDADICFLSDDDLEYKSDCIDIVIDSYNRYPQAGIITFKASKPNGQNLRNTYPKKELRHNFITAFGSTTFEITFRPQVIRMKGIHFDEMFGLGAQFRTAEDTVFVFDSIKAGVYTFYIPNFIVTHPEMSSGVNYSDSKLVWAKGAVLTRLFGSFLSLPMCFFFAYKQRKLYRQYYSFFKFIRGLLKGRTCYLQFLKNSKMSSKG